MAPLAMSAAFSENAQKFGWDSTPHMGIANGNAMRGSRSALCCGMTRLKCGTELARSQQVIKPIQYIPFQHENWPPAGISL
eukprot:scaffold38088_cov35-Attheya_sp.AAC.1